MGKADAGFEMTVVPGPHFSFSAFQYFSFFLRGAGGNAGLAGGGKE
jgi:hypothetical protein